MKITHIENINHKFVAKGKLVLVETTREDAVLARNYNDERFNIVSKDDIFSTSKWICFKPIIISETEEVLDCYVHNSHKILALSEQLSPKTLQDIVEGRIKNGDEVYLECDIHDEWLKENPPFSNPKEHSECYYQITLTAESHVTLVEKSYQDKLYDKDFGINRKDFTLDNMKSACAVGIDIANKEGANDFNLFADLINSIVKHKKIIIEDSGDRPVNLEKKEIEIDYKKEFYKSVKEMLIDIGEWDYLTEKRVKKWIENNYNSQTKK